MTDHGSKRSDASDTDRANTTATTTTSTSTGDAPLPSIAPTAEAAAPPPPADKEGTLNLHVLDQNGNEVFFRIKMQTPLVKLMNAYCERQSIDASSVRFLYNGQRIQHEQTPKELDMEAGDVIDAVLQQTGG